MLSLADFPFTMLCDDIAMCKGNGEGKGKEVARMMQRRCKEDARRLQGGCKEAARKLQGGYKEAARRLQGGCKEVAMQEIVST